VVIQRFRRRRALPTLVELLENYLVRGHAIAEAGGGDLWVVEPSVPPELLPEVAEAVARCLADHGIPAQGVTVHAETSTARIAVLDLSAKEPLTPAASRRVQEPPAPTPCASPSAR